MPSRVLHARAALLALAPALPAGAAHARSAAPVLVDSPILAGDLTVARTEVGATPVAIQGTEWEGHAAQMRAALKTPQAGRVATATVERVAEMTRNPGAALCVVAMIAAIVCVDVSFFKDRFWERLIVNIGIALVFTAFYFRFLKHP